MKPVGTSLWLPPEMAEEAFRCMTFEVWNAVWSKLGDRTFEVNQQAREEFRKNP